MTDLLQIASSSGAALLTWLAWMSAWTLILFVVARAADRALAGRVSAAWRTLLYAPIALRLLLPAQWASPLGVIAWDLGGSSSGAAGSAGPGLAGSGAVEGTLVATIGGADLALALVPLAYLAVLVMLAAAAFGARRRVRALLTASEPAPDWMQQLAGCAVVLTDAFGPAVVGRVRPVIAVPNVFASHLGQDALRWVLRHEAAHVLRRDLLLHDVLLAITLLAWPLVPVWLAARRVRNLLELACDETTLRGATSRERQDYMAALIDVTRSAAARTLRAAPAIAFVPGFGGSALLERVRAVRDGRRWPRALQAALVLAVVTLAAACTSVRNTDGERFEGPLLLALQARALTADEGTSSDLQQVLVESRIIQLSPQALAGLGHGGTTPEGDTVWRVDESVISGLLTQNSTSILTAPSVVTTAGQIATLFVGETLESDGEGENFRGLQIHLTPTIDEGDRVFMDVALENRSSERAVHTLTTEALPMPGPAGGLVLLETRRGER